MTFFRMTVQALVDRKLRSSLTILMVVIGVALIVAVQGMSTGMVKFMNDQFSSLSPDLLIVNPSSKDVDLDDPLVEAITQYEGVKEVIPFYQNGITISNSGGRDKQTIIMGVETFKLSSVFTSFSMYDGELVDDTDVYGLILGHDLAEPEDNLFANTSEIVKVSFQTNEGRKVVTVEKSFAIRGIVNEVGSIGFFPFDDMAFISIRAAKNLFDREVYDGIFVITAEKDGSLNSKVKEQIMNDYDVSIFTPASIAKMVSTVSGAMKTFVDNIALVSLGVAAVGIIATMYTSMLERTREIGTLKALGYTKQSILVIFLNEALLIGIIGSILGIGLGFVLGFIINEIMASGTDLRPIFELPSIVLVFVISIVLSIAAGWLPSKRAADLDPVIALRKE